MHTANLIYVDWNNKSQALWMQDFPWKDGSDSSRGSAFENDLIDYLGALKVWKYMKLACEQLRLRRGVLLDSCFESGRVYISNFIGMHSFSKLNPLVGRSGSMR